VKKATLQTPLHKDTTRVQILAWLDTVTAGLTITRDATREKVTAVADTLTEEVARLEAELQAALLSLGLAEQRIAALEIDKAELMSRLARLPDTGLSPT
jgi:chitinase